VKLLGDQAAAFDLPAYWRQLDGELQSSESWAPDRNQGPFITQAITAEAARRGLVAAPVLRQASLPFNRRELDEAKQIRHANGGCFHEPHCESYAACLVAIAEGRRETLAAAAGGRA